MLSRRTIMGGATVAAASLLSLRRARAAMLPTPAQTAGPFYPDELPLDSDNDLVRVEGQAAQALGTVAHIGGRVLDRNGRAITGARVEIWQCDANGRYHHPRDDNPAPLDAGFQGYGRTATMSDGAYRFRTIRPMPYPGRTPHIHFAIIAPGAEPLVTQMYVAGEPRNATDFVFNRIDATARERVLVTLSPADGIEAGALQGTFDIVLGFTA